MLWKAKRIPSVWRRKKSPSWFHKSLFVCCARKEVESRLKWMGFDNEDFVHSSLRKQTDLSTAALCKQFSAVASTSHWSTSVMIALRHYTQWENIFVLLAFTKSLLRLLRSCFLYGSYTISGNWDWRLSIKIEISTQFSSHENAFSSNNGLLVMFPRWCDRYRVIPWQHHERKLFTQHINSHCMMKLSDMKSNTIWLNGSTICLRLQSMTPHI